MSVAISARRQRPSLTQVHDPAILPVIAQTKRPPRNRQLAGMIQATGNGVRSDMLDADAAIIRRTVAPHRDDVLSEIAAEYRTFKREGPQFLQALDFHGRAGTATLRNAMTVLSDLDGDWRKPLPADVPLGHVEWRWQRHVVVAGKIDRTHLVDDDVFPVASGRTLRFLLALT